MINSIKLSLICFTFCFSFINNTQAQSHSIARLWNEVLLEAIRNDFARPTIHARNLFHASILMYDTWSIYDSKAEPYLLGKRIGDFQSSFLPDDKDLILENKDINKTISFAMYRFIMHRYSRAPKFLETKQLADSLMLSFGYNINYQEVDYNNGKPASLGNFIALEIIKYGLQDGANEQNDYVNEYYETINEALDPTKSDFSVDIDPNRWQPLFFNNFIDQSGNPIPEAVPQFLSPEWGWTSSFALEDFDRKLYKRDDNVYSVYLDPGPPGFIADQDSDAYKWGFSRVIEWSSHLDISDSVKIDISPSSIGNLTEFPSSYKSYKQFYKLDGGDPGKGWEFNPKTKQPYIPQKVLRGDYTRVLAEFWADGPDSETPPGHWFGIANYVMDHPDFVKRYAGKGDILSDLEYDVKLYFMLGGALHDAAIAAWSVKGYYDYIRPISALRYMATKGQSSDPTLPSYDKEGIPLRTGFIEIIEPGDPDFLGAEFIGQIKVRAWRGPSYIDNPDTDHSGVGWILATNWWPYQRPSFVTPPFAGYVSGHSTFSRAAAEIMTFITGDEFFPGGMGSFVAKKNEFLVFEEGPSTDIILQWATYRDASDQCSLSRIWGGIHPPVDDIPGRIIGLIVGNKAIRKADSYFVGEVNKNKKIDNNSTIVYPNPVKAGGNINIEIDGDLENVYLLNATYQVVLSKTIEQRYFQLPLDDLASGSYILVFEKNGFTVIRKLIIL